jgi:hypothetical protein
VVDLQQEGVDLNRRWVAVGLVFLAAMAGAQESRLAEGDLAVDVATDKFLATYRDGSWVPVDVVVNNNDRDISGHIEVTVLSAGRVSSPVCRCPAESPKGSRKRFRVYCHLDGATSLEVMLYHKKRPMLPIPMEFVLRPVDRQDILSMILDEEPTEFGFVYDAVHAGDGSQGIYRQGLRETELSMLPEYPQCYNPFDFFVMGKIDPNDIPLRQRELVRRYVHQGGVLVVCLGENAQRYKGTWVEELAGVAIGPQLMLDELQLARATFAPEDQQGARAGHQCIVTEVVPQQPDMRVRGRQPVLAAVRGLGSGYVVTLAVDAQGKALQKCVGYKRFWRDLILLHGWSERPNLAAATHCAAQELPATTGIRVYPRSSVFTYLIVYFVVAILGNWLVWSALKRREMAWVCLVIFSFGFTAYAMVYGTAGRAKATELEELEVLHISRSGTVAKLDSLVGILTARTARYAFDLAREYSLASEPAAVASVGVRMGSSGPLGGIRQNPFVVTQELRAKVSNFSVGASEMRLVHIESDVSLPGGVEGTLTLDQEGLHGTLMNQTGLKLRSPFILLDGKTLNVTPAGDGWKVDIPEQRLEVSAQQDLRSSFYGYQKISKQQMQNDFVSALWENQSFASQVNPALGPFLCGWVVGPRFGSVTLEEEVKKGVSETLAIADIDVHRADGDTTLWRTLPVVVRADYAQNQRYNRGNQWYDSAQYLQGGQAAQVEVGVPRALLTQSAQEIEVELLWVHDSGASIVLLPEGVPDSWSSEHADATTQAAMWGATVNKTVYRIEDWESLLDPKRKSIMVKVAVSAAAGQQARRYGGRFMVSARLKVEQRELNTGEWALWQ